MSEEKYERVAANQLYPYDIQSPAYLQTQHFHDLKDHIEDSTELPQKATNTFSTVTWILKKQKKIDPNQASRYCLRNT